MSVSAASVSSQALISGLLRIARSQAPSRPALISMSLTRVHLRVSDMWLMLPVYMLAAFDPKRQSEAPSTREAGCFTPAGRRRFIRNEEPLRPLIASLLMGFDLHVKRWHGGRLVDVASLGVSVVNGDRRMEGGKELRCSCREQEETHKNEKTFGGNSALRSSKSHRNERLWPIAISERTRPD